MRSNGEIQIRPRPHSPMRREAKRSSIQGPGNSRDVPAGQGSGVLHGRDRTSYCSLRPESEQAGMGNQMTRDEAIEIWDSQPNDFLEPADIIDKFAALGILKLDEPKSANSKFMDAMIARGYPQNSNLFADILFALDAAKTKIVER